MKALLDQQIVADCGSVASALEAARQRAGQAGRVIIEVKLDGVPLTDEELDAPATEISSARALECVSVDPAVLVAQSFRQAAGALDEARAIQQDAAGALSSGKTDEAFTLLGEAVGVWEAVKQVLEQGPGLLGVSAQSLMPGGSGKGEQVDFVSATTELSAALTGLKATLAMQDWASLADLLTVELDEQADRWTTLLVGMAEGAERLASNAGTGTSRHIHGAGT